MLVIHMVTSLPMPSLMFLVSIAVKTIQPLIVLATGVALLCLDIVWDFKLLFNSLEDDGTCTLHCLVDIGQCFHDFSNIVHLVAWLLLAETNVPVQQLSIVDICIHLCSGCKPSDDICLHCAVRMELPARGTRRCYLIIDFFEKQLKSFLCWCVRRHLMMACCTNFHFSHCDHYDNSTFFCDVSLDNLKASWCDGVVFISKRFRRVCRVVFTMRENVSVVLVFSGASGRSAGSGASVEGCRGSSCCADLSCVWCSAADHHLAEGRRV